VPHEALMLYFSLQRIRMGELILFATFLIKTRPLRVASTLRGHLSQIIPELLQWEKKFTSLDFSIVDVRMTSDLRLATLVIQDNNKESPVLLRYLNALAPHIQHKLAPHITGKYVPKVRFVFDVKQKKEKEMIDLMRSISKDLEKEEDSFE
jgi:ribosome-binding factor A